MKRGLMMEWGWQPAQWIESGTPTWRRRITDAWRTSPRQLQQCTGCGRMLGYCVPASPGQCITCQLLGEWQ